MRLPGDEIIEDVMTQYMRAITIDAPPDEVWSWLVEIGDRRARCYSCDWIERLVFLGTVHFVERTHSATRIHPELQEVHVGDGITTGSSDGSCGGSRDASPRSRGRGQSRGSRSTRATRPGCADRGSSPVKSCTMTIPGHGPPALGVATWAGMSPSGVRTVTSAIGRLRSLGRA